MQEKERCTHMVPQRGMNFHRLTQCSRPATTTLDGKPVCTVHSKDGEQVRRERQQQRFEQSRALKMATFTAHLRRKRT